MGSLFLDSPAGRFIASFPALSAAVGLLFAAVFVYVRFFKTPKLDLPVVGQPGDKWDAQKHIVAGARKVSSNNHSIETSLTTPVP